MTNNIPGASQASKTVALVVATLASFLTPFMGSSINIALPSIGREFSMEAVLLSWVATAYLLSAAIFLLPFGRLADIYGRKKIFALGIMVVTVSSILSALAGSAFAVIGFRVLQGIGSAMIFGTSVAILTSVFPASQRGRVLGINVASVYLGLSLGPFLGGLLTQHFGWRSIFWANVPLAITVLLLVFWKLKGEWAEARGEKFDLPGSIIYALMLTSLMYGLSRVPAPQSIWLIGLGLAGMALFLFWESRTASPVFRLSLFRRNTVFALSNLAALINYSATFAVSFLLSLYLQNVRGFSPQSAGMILLSQPIIQAFLSPFAGRLSDRIEPRVVASIGMSLTFAALVLLSFVNTATPLPFLVANLMVLGLGFALFSSPNTNAIMSSVDKRFYGIASATLGTMRLTGNMLSMGIVTLVFAVFLGSVQITPEYYPAFLNGMKVAFIIFSALCFGGIFASLSRGRVRPEIEPARGG